MGAFKKGAALWVARAAEHRVAGTPLEKVHPFSTDGALRPDLRVSALMAENELPATHEADVSLVAR